MPSKEPLSIKVTKIGNRYHCRMFRKEILFEELTCRNKSSIHVCIKFMLRWYDKAGCSPFSPMAYASRNRDVKSDNDALAHEKFNDRIERVFPTKNIIYSHSNPPK